MGAFLDSQSLTRLQERAACRASLGSSRGGCGHFPARNCWTARGRFFAASGQNARTPSFPGRARSRGSRICSRPAPKRRLENDHSPASTASRNYSIVWFANTSGKPRAPSRFRGWPLLRHLFASFTPKTSNASFCSITMSHAKACPGRKRNSRKLNHGPCMVQQRPAFSTGACSNSLILSDSCSIK